MIKRLQRKKKLDEITSSVIKNGVKPTLFEINSKMEDYYLNHILGETNFQYEEIKPHSKSDINKWNSYMNNIEKDLALAYEGITETRNNILSKEEELYSAIKKASLDIKNTNERIKALKEILNNEEVYEANVITFNNFKVGEFKENKDINLPRTTGFIDLLTNRFTSEKKSGTKSIIDLSNSNISIHSEIGNILDIYNGLNNTLSNYNRQEYTIITQVNHKDEPNSINLEVLLDKPVEMSTITLEAMALSSLIASVTITDEMGSVEHLSEEEFFDIVEFNFTKRKVMTFNLKIKKLEADEFNEKEYIYKYIISNISAYNDIYDKVSIYVSNQIPFNEIIGYAHLKANDRILPETNIKYFVGIDNGKDCIDWLSIEKNKDTDLHILLEAEKIFYSNPITTKKELVTDKVKEKLPSELKITNEGKEYILSKVGDIFVYDTELIPGEIKVITKTNTYKHEIDIPESIPYNDGKFKGELTEVSRDRKLLSYEQIEGVIDRKTIIHNDTTLYDNEGLVPQSYSYTDGNGFSGTLPLLRIERELISYEQKEIKEHDEINSEAITTYNDWCGKDHTNSKNGVLNQETRADVIDAVYKYKGIYEGEVVKNGMVDDLTRPIYSDWTVLFEGDVAGPSKEVTIWGQYYEGLVSSLPYDRFNCSKIGVIKKHFNNNSIKMIGAYQQWKVEVLRNKKFEKNYKINISDYNKEDIVEETTIDCESYKLKLKPYHLITMEQVVYCKEPSFIDRCKIQALKGNKFQYEVYINNSLVKENIDGELTLAFSKGKNKVVVVMHNEENSVLDILFKMNFKKVSFKISGEGYMKKVSLDTLRYRVPRFSKGFYAIDSLNNIYTKYIPIEKSNYVYSDIDEGDFNYQDTVRYYLNYKYLNPKYFSKCLINNEPKINLRLGAKLISNDDSISPILHNYTLMGR